MIPSYYQMIIHSIYIHSAAPKHPSMEGIIKKAEDVPSVDVYTAMGHLSVDHMYLDVRTQEEFDRGHVENAIHVPYMFITPEGKVKNPDFLSSVETVCKKENKLIVGCNSGGRGRLACIDLLNAGYENVSNMEGGYSKWVDSGLAGGGEELKTACKFRP